MLTAPYAMWVRVRCQTDNEKADVFSFGMLMWEVLHVRVPFAGRNALQALLCVHANQRPQIRLPADLRAYEGIINRCWHQVPQNRLSMAELEQKLLQLEQAGTSAGPAEAA